MTEQDYQPVSCETHSHYELAIMQQRKLRLSWRDASGRILDAEVLPLDIQTRDGAEYLLVQHGGQTLSLRLDQIKPQRGTPT